MRRRKKLKKTFHELFRASALVLVSYWWPIFFYMIRNVSALSLVCGRSWDRQILESPKWISVSIKIVCQTASTNFIFNVAEVNLFFATLTVLLFSFLYCLTIIYYVSLKAESFGWMRVVFKYWLFIDLGLVFSQQKQTKI